MVALAASGAAACGESVCEAAAGAICTVAGSGVAGLRGEGTPPLDAELFLPQDVAVGPDGGLFIVDWNNHAVRAVRDEAIRTVVGVPGVIGNALEGPALEREIHHPAHVAFEPSGDMIVSAWHNYLVLRYRQDDGRIERIAGTGEPGFNGDGALATETRIDMPVAVVPMPGGGLAVSDQINQRIRRIGADGAVTTIAGTGEPGYSGDGGPAVDAQIDLPEGAERVPAGRIDVDETGAIYLADTRNNAIRRIDPDGVIETLARAGGGGGGALSVDLDGPADVAVAEDGAVYVADTLNSCVRRLEPAGRIATVAGRCGERGYSGDGGPANEALLDRPYGIALGEDGVLYVADTHNHVIRAVYPNSPAP